MGLYSHQQEAVPQSPEEARGEAPVAVTATTVAVHCKVKYQLGTVFLLAMVRLGKDQSDQNSSSL